MSKKAFNKAKQIQLIVTDVDGVWTDSKFYYNNDGFAFKCFSTYDGMAIELLKKMDLETIIISSEFCSRI